MGSIQLDILFLNYITIHSKTIIFATDSGVKNLVNLPGHIHNIFQFKQVLKKHFLYSYSLQ